MGVRGRLGGDYLRVWEREGERERENHGIDHIIVFDFEASEPLFPFPVPVRHITAILPLASLHLV